MTEKNRARLWLIVLLIGIVPAAWGQNAEENLRAEQVAKLQGMIGTYEGEIAGKYAIRLQLSLGSADTLVTGLYYYLSKGQPLALRGFTRASIPTQQLELREQVPTDTAATGWFTIGLSNAPELLGVWYNKSGTALYPLSLRRIGGADRPPGLVAHVTSKTYLKSFRVPKLTVPDAGVTHLLAHRFSLENLTGDDVAGLRHELEEHSGIQSADYTVNYNARGLLSLTALSEGLGASVWYNNQTHNLDLVTGFSIVLADELKPELLPQFLALGQRKLAVKTKECVSMQDDFLSAEDKAGVLSQQFTLSSTDEYIIGTSGLVFDHQISYDGLSNFVWKVLQGNFPVKFTYAELRPFLKPNSPLQRLLPR